MATSEALLIGRRRDLAIGLVGGFAAAVTVVMGVALAADLAGLSIAAALADVAVPLLLFYAPAPLAAAGAYTRCGGPACLAVGVVPTVVFGALVIVGTVAGVPGFGGGAILGNGTLAGTAAGYAAVGLTSAFVGYCAGVTAALVADVVGIRSGDD